MTKFAVVKTGGKQYLVKEQDEIIVDKIVNRKGSEIELETLAIFDEDGKDIEFGAPVLKKSTKAQVIEDLKGEKLRIARFKAKVRYRKVKGFRPQLSKIKILAI